MRDRYKVNVFKKWAMTMKIYGTISKRADVNIGNSSLVVHLGMHIPKEDCILPNSPRKSRVHKDWEPLHSGVIVRSHRQKEKRICINVTES